MKNLYLLNLINPDGTLQTYNVVFTSKKRAMQMAEYNAAEMQNGTIRLVYMEQTLNAPDYDWTKTEYFNVKNGELIPPFK